MQYLFIALYATSGKTVLDMREHLKSHGWVDGVDCVEWVGLIRCGDGWNRVVGLGVIECCRLVGFRSGLGCSKCC